MKLSNKIALYNSLTKIVIILVLSLVIYLFTDDISNHHLQERLVDKRKKFMLGLTQDHIDDLIQSQANFTDYNILKEEFIILTPIKEMINISRGNFTKQTREIEGEMQEYLVYTYYFRFNEHNYRLEIGETMSVLTQLEKSIWLFTFLVLLISIAVTLIIDIAFTNRLLRPFYNIVDKKLNKIHDPLLFSYIPEKTNTEDFVLLDKSLMQLMEKVSRQLDVEKQFTSNVSHELLTPITTLSTRFENILNDKNLSASTFQKINASLVTLSFLKRTIKDLLLIAKIENGQYDKFEKISPVNVIDEITQEMEDLLTTRNIRLHNMFSKELYITGNPTLMHILFANLIKNAIKYNKQHGMIRVSNSVKNGGIVLFFEDSGTGMTEEVVKRIFNRYERFSLSQEEGHGLGLAIVKSIASFHSISIHVSSVLDKGTTIELGLPISQV
ncbi:MAG TPA: HAMP domain-containing sensor histidine kinase [Pseudosphingobacterium sp.]|nr:HAMP domain-containing sensor histidine kinase [Pseudosphingobacterium sp.]